MFKRLLVPLDGTDLSTRAIQASVTLARQLGATLTGFVVEPPVPLPSHGAGPQPAGASVEELRNDEHAQRLLRRLRKQASAAGVACDGHHRHAPDIGSAIVQAAREYGCDLIVMTTHGRGLLGRLLLGSQTRAVLARSAVPVLVLR
jgi:nucleotide-binding universal stress UspA family protein